MNILNPDDFLFEHTNNGFLKLHLKKKTTYERVECIPLFPHSKIDKYISISGRLNKEKDTEEIGIIKNLSELSSDQRLIIKNDINFRYFMPIITNIKKITSKFGLYQCEVTTDRGEKTFFVKDARENVKLKENGLIIITDFDKCRYKINDYNELPLNARAELEYTLL